MLDRGASGRQVASASDWLAAFPVGIPASSRIDEPSAVMKEGRSLSRAVCTDPRVARCPASPGRWPGEAGVRAAYATARRADSASSRPATRATA